MVCWFGFGVVVGHEGGEEALVEKSKCVCGGGGGPVGESVGVVGGERDGLVINGEAVGGIAKGSRDRNDKGGQCRIGKVANAQTTVRRGMVGYAEGGRSEG